MKIKVLVVDDHDIVRQGIKAVLTGEENILVIGEAGNGRQAIEKAHDLNPDVILMDVRMPGGGGIRAAKTIIEKQPNVKIIALSAFDGDEEVFGSIEAGVCGYVLKDIPPSQLGKAIRMVFEGKSQLDPGIAHKLISNIAQKNHEPDQNGIELTRREQDVIALIGQGLKNRDIATRLWISEKTVKVYIGRLFKKLGCSSRTELLVKGSELNLIEIKRGLN